MAHSVRFPGRVLADLVMPALSLLPGQRPAQDARCAAVGNCFISAPISARIVAAETVSMPGMLSRILISGVNVCSIVPICSSRAANSVLDELHMAKVLTD